MQKQNIDSLFCRETISEDFIFYHMVNIECQLSLTNIMDIVASSISLCDADNVDHILGIFPEETDAIQQLIGAPPITLNTVLKTSGKHT